MVQRLFLVTSWQYRLLVLPMPNQVLLSEVIMGILCLVIFQKEQNKRRQRQVHTHLLLYLLGDA
jgi:hypothetical protein